jgi:hypothetical protein
MAAAGIQPVGAAMRPAATDPKGRPSPGERPDQSDAVEVLNPRGRVPLSLIIDDSTCLVNLAHFGMPQFGHCWPDRKEYQKDWRSMPREIPDAFVRKFGQWCRENGVKGKYSIVPYPACVGWLDRALPGWSHTELRDSLALVRDFMAPDWDIHPEMVSHTYVIDMKTGRPYEQATPEYMENWRWTDDKSAEQIAEYMAYALRILKNVDLPCEGITTPGGFGSRVLAGLAQATLMACREVYDTEIPHYFRHLFTDETSVAPRVEYASGLDGNDPKCVVSIIGCTGDWFGGWDGVSPGSADRFITEDLQSGRMVEVIGRGEPAIMVGHWPGFYFNGEEVGFKILKEAVGRLHKRYDNLIAMNLAEISRYWAAKELTSIEKNGNRVILNAPFASPQFTIAVSGEQSGEPRMAGDGGAKPLEKAARLLGLRPGTWTRENDRTVVCFDLPKGRTEIAV